VFQVISPASTVRCWEPTDRTDLLEPMTKEGTVISLLNKNVPSCG